MVRQGDLPSIRPDEIKHDPSIPPLDQVLHDLFMRTKQDELPVADIQPDDILAVLRLGQNDIVRLDTDREIKPDTKHFLKILSMGGSSPHAIDRVIKVIESGDFSQLSTQDMQAALQFISQLRFTKSKTYQSPSKTQQDEQYYNERTVVVILSLIRSFLQKYIFTHQKYMYIPEYENLCNVVDLDPATPEIPGINVNQLAQNAITLHTNMMEGAQENTDGVLIYQEDKPLPNTVTERVHNSTNGIQTTRTYHHEPGTKERTSVEMTVAMDIEGRNYGALKSVSVTFIRKQQYDGQLGKWQFNANMGDNVTWKVLVDDPRDQEWMKLVRENKRQHLLHLLTDLGLQDKN